MEGIWTFAIVEQRLIEALDVLNRLPDREAGWRKVQTMSLWRQIPAEFGVDANDDDMPRRPGVTRRELADMEEALGWLVWVPSGDTRRILGMALHKMLRGDCKLIPWTDIWRRLKARGEHGWTTNGLRMRYGRAIGTICERLNGLSASQIWSEPTGKASISGCRGRQAVKSSSDEISHVRPTGGEGL